MTVNEYFKTHGISKASIKKFDITSSGSRITLPITDPDGTVLFNKYRNLDNKPGKFSYDEGASATIFNLRVLQESKYVFICEGEFDAIRLDQEGIAAVSNTSGASTFKEEWVEHFRGKRVYIVYDQDEAGREGAKKLKAAFPNAIVVTLPDETNDICEYFQTHSVGDFKTMVEAQRAEQTVTYGQLCATIDKWLLLPDKNVIRILLATMVSHFFASDPLWMFFVAPPSGSKTEIISTVIDLPFVHFLSDLTPQTFVSGMIIKKGGKDPSLLLKLKDNVLVMKDFTTVLTMRGEDRAVILSQLREIYDGRYSKAFGTGKEIHWEGRLTLIAGVTTIIDTYSSMTQIMGERFVMYRVPQSDAEQVADLALGRYGQEKEMRDEMKKAMSDYFLSLDIPAIEDIKLPTDIRRALGSLSSFVVQARSGIVRNQFRRDIEFIPESEAPARFAKQIGTLIKALAVLEGRDTVNWSDYYLTMRVALDVIPSNRMKHIIAVAEAGENGASTADMAIKTGYSHGGSELILEDLVALKVLKLDAFGAGVANTWQISDKTWNYFKKILPTIPRVGPSENRAGFDSAFPVNSPYIGLVSRMINPPDPPDPLDEILS